jgi:pyruvate/2-oxoglutarate/acetoin dehydrogenase E1 component
MKTQVISMGEAIKDAQYQLMKKHPEIFLIGVGICDPNAVYKTIDGFLEEFGEDRIIEGPIAEQMLTGFCFGASANKYRPILIHHRMDFILLSLDQIINHMAKYPYMFGGQQRFPLVIRSVVGRGWGNAAQHTQSFHGLLSSFPGIQVVVPSNPYDAKGLLASAIMGNDPVIFIEHRWLHGDKGEVPEELYEIPIGVANIVREGSDYTLVAAGPMVQQSLKAAQDLKESHDLNVEVIDLRSIRPIDFPTIFTSVKKTGHLLVADSDWPRGGITDSIISEVTRELFTELKSAPHKVTWPDHAVPASSKLEAMFYPGAKDIAHKIVESLQKGPSKSESVEKEFLGPY